MTSGSPSVGWNAPESIALASRDAVRPDSLTRPANSAPLWTWRCVCDIDNLTLGERDLLRAVQLGRCALVSHPPLRVYRDDEIRLLHLHPPDDFGPKYHVGIGDVGGDAGDERSNCERSGGPSFPSLD